MKGKTNAVLPTSTPSSDFKFTMLFDADNFINDPDNCLVYSDGCRDYTPVSGPGADTTVAGCSIIGSWEMNADGTSSNPLLEKCFYATFTDAGVLHQKLNPQDLSQYIATWDNSSKKWVTASGTSSITTENTMFCIPTLYVSSTSASISLSSKSSEGTAFGHTIDGHVYEYMAIAVYPGSVSDGKLRSFSEVASVQSGNYANYTSQCAKNIVEKGHALLCNWYQWQLFRLIVIFTIRHFDSQGKIGYGNTFLAKHGGKNAMGVFAGSVSGSGAGVKAYIEDPWAHFHQMIGDVYYTDGNVYVFQTSSQNPTSTEGGVCLTQEPYLLFTTDSGYPETVSDIDITWGCGLSQRESGDTVGTFDYWGFNLNETNNRVGVGGVFNDASFYSGISRVRACKDNQQYLTARLTYVFDL
jgi:hypothetical protein